MNGWLARSCIAGPLILLIVTPSSGQKTGPPPTPSAPTTSVPVAQNPTESNGPHPPNLVYGRVVMDNGRPVPESVPVELRCGIQLVSAIHTDPNGNFQFTLGEGQRSNDTYISASEDSTQVVFPAIGPSAVGLSGCEVDVSVPGYQPVSKSLINATDPRIDTGTFILTRIAGVEGSAISVTSMLAPKEARKELEKGERDVRSKHVDSATKHLERAVAEYDAYAVAWNELGEIHAISRQTEEARKAFEKSMAADPQYIPPFLGLAKLELESGRFEDAIEAAGKALKLYPGLAAASFIQGVANLQLNRLDAAEKSARDAEKGPHQNLSQVHILLANILLRREDYPGAAEEMQAYLKESPRGGFAAETKERLAQIQKLIREGTSGSGPDTQASAKSPPGSPAAVEPAMLKVDLRAQDDSPFIGSAKVRVTSSEGREARGAAGSDGETVFDKMPPGSYTVEADAPGFLAVREQTDIEGGRLHTLFVIMRPIPLFVDAAQLSTTVSSAAAGSLDRTDWLPRDVDSLVPSVQTGVACPLTQVVSGAGRRMADLVQNLEKFDATEHVQHFNVGGTGERGTPETRTFDYVATITLSKTGVFQLDEYRDGSLDPSKFPAQIATIGLASMALIFHPSQVSGFNLTCEGLGQWDGHPAWQVHFAQRSDRPNRTLAYVIGGMHYSVPLKGRAWIDAATYQVLRLESELMKPVEGIALTQHHVMIDYGPVQFQTHSQQLWLPLDAEVYWERRGRRFYRQHSFSDFKVFEVDSAQQIQAPKQSYCFENPNDRDIDGVLTVSPVPGASEKAVSIHLTIPSGRSVCKFVGLGMDVSIPADDVSSAILNYNGPAGAITGEANLVKESVLDLVPEAKSVVTP